MFASLFSRLCVSPQRGARTEFGLHTAGVTIRSQRQAAAPSHRSYKSVSVKPQDIQSCVTSARRVQEHVAPGAWESAQTSAPKSPISTAEIQYIVPEQRANQRLPCLGQSVHL